MAGATAEPTSASQESVTVCPAYELLQLFSMSFALALLILTCGAVAVIVQQLRRAPEAFEDQTGFHFSSSTGNRLPEESVSRRRAPPVSIGIAVRRVREAH